MFKKIVCFDFDGVIHSYTSKWVREDVISDPPVEGIKEVIADIRQAGYKVVVFSSRCKYVEGRHAIATYLDEHGIVVDDIADTKPPAYVTIDDRAICFDGRTDNLLERIDNFRVWNR